MLLGDALLEEGMATAAVASYRNALVVAEDDTLEGLVERCRSLVSLAPDVGVAHSLLGQALQKQGDYDEAMVELQRAADLVPENTSYQTAIASVYGDLGREALADRRPNEAIHHFEAGLAIDPTSDTLKGGLAQAHLDVSKWWLARGVEDKAFTELCAAKQHAPSDDEDLGADLAQAFNQLGDRYRYQEESDWAISCYQRAFDLDATNTAYRSELATAYDTRGSERFDTGEYELAEADYQAAVDLYPGRQSYLDHLQAAQDAQ